MKRKLLGVVRTGRERDAVLALLKRKMKQFSYEVAELPLIDDPADVVYEIYATTSTDWRGHERLLAFFDGVTCGFNFAMTGVIE